MNNKGNFEVLCEIGIKIRVVNVDRVAITFHLEQIEGNHASSVPF